MPRRSQSRNNPVGWTMKRKVIDLMRVSTEEQAADERAEIPAQRAANAKTAKRYGLEPVKTLNILRLLEIHELVRSPTPHKIRPSISRAATLYPMSVPCDSWRRDHLPAVSYTPELEAISLGLG